MKSFNKMIKIKEVKKMKRLISSKKWGDNIKFKRLSAILVTLLVALILPVTAFAWGPDRELFTSEKPASFVTFNSIKNNVSYGDERNFLQVKEADADNSTYSRSASLQPGKEYQLYLYFHNNAAINYNLTAVNAYAKVELPALVRKGSDGTKAVGYVGASNATPKQVWADISFKNSTGGDIALRYVPDSAVIHSRGAVNGMKVSNDIVTAGAPIGYDKLNGEVPGCNEFAGYITFRVKADQPGFEVVKQVRKAGTKTWSKSVDAKPGDKLEYQVEYKNTGTTQQDNVILRDKLPAGLTYVAGSTKLKNANNPNAKDVKDGIVGDGINIGNYAPVANAYVLYAVTVDEKDDLVCLLKNEVSAITPNGTKKSEATVDLGDACDPDKPITPVTPEGSDEVPGELPKTGPFAVVMTVIVVAVAVLAGSYWYSKKRGKKSPRKYADIDEDITAEEALEAAETVITDAPDDEAKE